MVKFWKFSWKTGKETMIPPTPSISYIVLKAPAREINQGNKRQNEWERKKYNPSYSDDMIMYTEFRRPHRCGVWIIRWSQFTALFWGYQSYWVYCCCLLAKPRPTLCDPMDCSPPGSSVRGIFQAGILEWVAISFSRGSFPSQLRDQTPISCIGRWILYHWATREDPWFG